MKAIARGRIRPTSGVAFAGYLTLSLLFFGLRVLAHPERTYVGGLAADPQIFIWSFGWWPHAILHGQNPFSTHAIWAPSGFNLTWATSIPGLSLAFAPLTLAFGPVASYNAACVLVSALSAWTAFLLCRHVTHAFWPALAGGYLFGFSSYMVGAELDTLHTASVFLVPVVALLVLRFLERGLSRTALSLALGAVLALQMLISTELLFTLTLTLASALVLGFVFVPAARERLVALLPPLAGAYVLAALVTSPFLYFLLTGTKYRPRPGPDVFVADALNFVIPTRITALGSWWTHGLAEHFPTNDSAKAAYLGLPTLIIVAWFGVRRARTPTGRFLLAALALSAVASLGSWLTVDGRHVVQLPWIHLSGLPLFENTMPVRFAMFTALAAAVIVSLWAASGDASPRVRWSLTGLAALALVPNVSLSIWARSPHTPSLFTTGEYKRCLRQGENILVFPYGPRGDSMIWQAESDFWFRQAGGYISPLVPGPFLHPPGLAHVTTADNAFEVTLGDVLELARLKSVTSIVVDARRSEPWRALLSRVARPEVVGGVLIFRLHAGKRPDPACARA